MNTAMNIVLISTYELGRQPFGLASPAAWLARAGAHVRCLDLSRDAFREDVIRDADLIAFYVPMHTATRLAVELLDPVRKFNPRAHICFYGLYAPVNEPYLRGLGVETILGGEFEEGLVALSSGLRQASAHKPAEQRREPAPALQVISLARQSFLVPQRNSLPSLDRYAHLILPDGTHRVAGYTEASRGCKHLCRHCPIVPVYDGTFRIVQREVVRADIRQQVAAGAEHITFGDPDFFNGPAHAMAIVEAMHREFPALTYDVTIKIEHLLRHANLLPRLRDTGCAFVTSAVESVDDVVLAKLDKGHTRADFLAVVELFREAGLVLHPTFVPFMPWTTLAGYCELLRVIAEHKLVENVAPIQLAIRLLIPAGSRLLELEEIRSLVQPFDAAALVYPWLHEDPRVDKLASDVQEIVHRGEKLKQSRGKIFLRIWEAAHAAAELAYAPPEATMVSRAAVPYLNEPWYC
jgi:radical SAM superfamily enzyme YgiQ (UPF0313 family)